MKEKGFQKMMGVVHVIVIFTCPLIPCYLSITHLIEKMKFNGNVFDYAFTGIIAVVIEITGVASIHTFLESIVYNKYEKTGESHQKPTPMLLPGITTGIYVFCITSINILSEIAMNKLVRVLILTALIFISLAGVVSVFLYMVFVRIKTRNEQVKEDLKIQQQLAREKRKEEQRAARERQQIEEEARIAATKKWSKTEFLKLIKAKKNIKEIAEITGSNEGAVKRRIQRYRESGDM